MRNAVFLSYRSLDFFEKLTVMFFKTSIYQTEMIEVALDVSVFTV
jgi:hypothetical protein